MSAFSDKTEPENGAVSSDQTSTDSVQPDSVSPDAAPPDPFAWYVVHVYSGFEKKTAEAIKEQALLKGFENKIQDVLVPTEEVIELRRGTKVQSERKFFPGYILVQMDMTNETWNFIKAIPKVTDFLGSQGRPSRVSTEEIRRIKNQVDEGTARPRAAIAFQIGDQVRVSDGPFTSFSGSVEDIDAEKSRLKVLVSIFGRATPVDLDFSQVEKL